MRERVKQICFYRGDVPGRSERIQTGRPDWDSYLFVTESIEGARMYGFRISKVCLITEARVLREGTRDFQRVFSFGRRNQSMLEWAANGAQRALRAGWDVVWFKRQTDIGTVILNREVVDTIEVIE